LKTRKKYDIVCDCDILFLAPSTEEGPETIRRCESMNKSELAVVVSAKIEDEDRAATIEKVKEYITRFGGTVTEVDEWGKKRLAYEIQKMREGFYYFVRFEADAACPAEVERRVRIMENVIRYLCVRQDA
jgi:small subunit ribosomal protein S6